jgi:hypothetical protein
MDFVTIGMIAASAGVLAWVLGVLRSKKSKPPVELEEAAEEVEPELTDDELALLLGRAELKRAREKLLARVGRGGSQGARRGAPLADLDEDELPN